MYYVLLTKPLPGVRSTVFVFNTERAAVRFQDRTHRRFPDAQTEQGKVGSAIEVEAAVLHNHFAAR